MCLLTFFIFLMLFIGCYADLDEVGIPIVQAVQQPLPLVQNLQPEEVKITPGNDCVDCDVPAFMINVLGIEYTDTDGGGQHGPNEIETYPDFSRPRSPLEKLIRVKRFISEEADKIEEERKQLKKQFKRLSEDLRHVKRMIKDEKEISLGKIILEKHQEDRVHRVKRALPDNEESKQLINEGNMLRDNFFGLRVPERLPPGDKSRKHDEDGINLEAVNAGRMFLIVTIPVVIGLSVVMACLMFSLERSSHRIRRLAV